MWCVRGQRGFWIRYLPEKGGWNGCWGKYWIYFGHAELLLNRWRWGIAIRQLNFLGFSIKISSNVSLRATPLLETHFFNLLCSASYYLKDLLHASLAFEKSALGRKSSRDWNQLPGFFYSIWAAKPESIPFYLALEFIFPSLVFLTSIHFLPPTLQLRQTRIWLLWCLLRSIVPEAEKMCPGHWTDHSLPYVPRAWWSGGPE